MQRLPDVAPVVNFGMKALTSIQSVSGLDVLVMLGAVGVVAATAKNSHKLYRALAGNALPSTEEINFVNAVKDSVMKEYELAVQNMNDGALGNAMIHIERAIKEFELTLKAHPAVEKLVVENQTFRAKLLFLRAQIHYLQTAYVFAERDLLAAIKCDDALTPALNMLVHLYSVHLLNQLKKVSVYLARSQELEKDQLFVRFYIAKAKGDVETLDNIALELIQLYEAHLQDMEHPSHKWRRLHETTPLLAIPYLMKDWIDYKIDNINDPIRLLKVIKTMEAMLEEPGLVYIKHIRALFHESKVHLYERLADIRENDAQYSAEESRLLVTHCLMGVGGDKEAEAFIACHTSQIDKTIINMFPLQTSCEYLQDAAHANEVAYMIRHCAIQGWFKADKNETIQQLCRLLRDTKNSDATNEDINKICADPKTIEYFIKTYLQDKGWEPWLQPIRFEEGKIGSFINLACAQQKVNMCVYNKADTKLLQLAMRKDNYGENTLHLFYDADKNAFEILHPVRSPSALYQWLAFKLCWKLLLNDVDNKFARDYLRHCLCTLPAPHAVIPNEQSSVFARLFTPGKMLALGGVVAAAGVAAYCLSGNRE